MSNIMNIMLFDQETHFIAKELLQQIHSHKIQVSTCPITSKLLAW